ncbi:GntR family transcriptional regulator (plasmid) [Tistrella mobilis]|uniref:GntR family transcriptional regulator n=1 Tax=Tistrella mobilis TaxID=171437 RepID=UPI0035581C76
MEQDQAADLTRDPAAAAADGPEIPRYLQVFQEIRDRISDGLYPVGSLVPTEAELCAEFAVSRYTVREALRRLVEQGYVERRQGSGTHVLSAEPGSIFSQSMRSLSELFQYALDTDFRIHAMAMERLDEPTARLIGTEPAEPWLHIHGVRSAQGDGAPISYTEVFVPERFAWLQDEFPNCHGPFYALIEQRARVTVMETLQTITALPMPPESRRLFDDTRPEAHVLRVVRRYLDRKGRPLIASVNDHPADRYSYTMRIKRDGG